MKSTRNPNTAAKRLKVLSAYRDLIEEDNRAAEQLKATGRRETPWISNDQFAASHHISKSTLYRWLGLERKKVASPPNLTDVNRSIEILQSEEVEDWEFIAAAMNFSAWFVFPLAYFRRCSRTLSLAASHSSIEGDYQTFDNFQPEIQRALQRFMTAGLLRRLSDLNDPSLGDYDYYSLFETGYTERDVLRSVGFRFMEAHSKGAAVSINKVGALLENGRLLDGLQVRPAMFASLWRDYAPTIPFVCAENTAGLDWHLEFNRKSDERLEALMRDRRQVREFFRIARLYVDRFRQSLDRRAWQRLRMPILSDETLT